MGKITVLIVEDEQEQAEKLKEQLEKANFTVTACAGTLQEALGLYYSQKPDLVLCDIYLNGQPEGITFAQRINENQNTSRPIIFLTQHADLGTFERAKLTGPYNYLLKPYNPLELQFAIELALEKFLESPNVFSAGADQGIMKEQNLFVKAGNAIFKVSVMDIYHIEVDGKYSQIMTEQGKFLIQQPLKKIEELLDSQDFVRIHRNYMINSHKIRKIHLGDSQVMLVNDTCIPFSQSYKERLMDRFEVLK